MSMDETNEVAEVIATALAGADYFKTNSAKALQPTSSRK